MSIARHHAEWLSLLDVSGSFLSMPALLRAFPNGLDAHDADVARRLRSAYNEWQATQGNSSIATAAQRRWVTFVLADVLGFPPELIAEGQRLPPGLQARLDAQGETLQPDMAILERHSAVPKARVLVQIYPSTQPLDKNVPGRRWMARPDARMMELLRATDVRLGLVTNGEQWMLVYAPPKETTTYVTWQASLWLDEPLTLRAFCSLLKAQRFFGMADDQSLEALLRESANNQQEVTDQLGLQVRRAVEILVQAIDRSDQDRGGRLLQDVAPHAVYESALTVMMRLVFLFSAEERNLLLLGAPLYDQNYAVSTLGAQLREAADQHGEEVMEHRFDAWCRLLATFRAVHGGARHDLFQLPAYGSSLFDPDRFSFLEGRADKDTPLHDAAPLPINNRVTLHLLDALQWLKVKLPGGGGTEPRRLSFRGLDIEQIGHVYEGLLDHDAQRAREPVLGLKGAGSREPEIALAQLEAVRAKGEDALIAFLCEETGRSVSAVRNALLPLPLGEGRGEGKWRAACNNDEALLRRVLPFAGLVRDDDFDAPVVINAGSVFVTQTGTRRATGTHYTPRSLTEPIVQHTLEPLVYAGPADGWPRERWRLRSPRELLQLKVCDMAMGSGAFLVQTCRYLSERLIEAWANLELRIENAELRMQNVERKDEAGGSGAAPNSQFSILNSAFLIQITPEGTPPSGRPNEQLIPQDEDERLIFARRIVADRCLYGVDKNPMAVEMAKLSLWLITMGRDRPFTFLDHALKCGDSLAGADVEMYRRWATSNRDAGTRMLDAEVLDEWLDVARDKRRELESFDVVEIADAERKQALLDEAEAAVEKVKLGCDLLIGTRLLGLKPKAIAERNAALVEEFVRTRVEDLRERAGISDDALDALEAARKVRAFHWPLEFPEVFDAPPAAAGGGTSPWEVGGGRGFSAFVGNPPFIGGQKISGELGKPYLDYLNHTWSHTRGSADICAYFFLRAMEKVRAGGNAGLIATNTIAQGDTRERGLDHLVKGGVTIYNATNNMPWPGEAAVAVNVVHLHKGVYRGSKQLDRVAVHSISPMLEGHDGAHATLGNPKRLLANAHKSFQGSIVLGMGFVLEPEEAQRLIDKDPRNKEVLFPYLNGEDLNSRPDQSPSRWVINFHDWTIEESQTYSDCFDLIKKLVKHEREKQKDKGGKLYWWRHLRPRPELYTAIKPLKQVLVCSNVSKWSAFCFVPVGSVMTLNLCIFATEDQNVFCLLQSTIHELWGRKHSSTLEDRLKYSIVDAFETCPFPENGQNNLHLGDSYHDHRRQIMLARSEGLTKTYNRFHDPSETSADIAHLRALHVEMDNAVAVAYGWDDLALGHGFHDTAQGVRYTLAEPVRRTVLTRLLELNHQRWEEEQAEARRQEAEENPLGKKPKRKGAKQSALPLTLNEPRAQYGLFGGGTRANKRKAS